MSPWIVYSLVIVFFLALPLVIFVFIQTDPASSTQTRSAQSHAAHEISQQTEILSYVVLAAIFALMLTVTIFTREARKIAT